jgi:hypothetical protein
MKNIRHIEIDGVGWIAPERTHWGDVLIVSLLSVAVSGLFAYAVLASIRWN